MFVLNEIRKTFYSDTCPDEVAFINSNIEFNIQIFSFFI